MVDSFVIWISLGNNIKHIVLSNLSLSVFHVFISHSLFSHLCFCLQGELDFFRSVSSAADKSSYNVCNLSQAVTITKQDIDWVAARNNIDEKNLDSNMPSSDDLNYSMASSSSVYDRDRVHPSSCLSPSSMLSVQTHKHQEIKSAVLSSQSRGKLEVIGYLVLLSLFSFF